MLLLLWLIQLLELELLDCCGYQVHLCQGHIPKFRIQLDQNVVVLSTIFLGDLTLCSGGEPHAPMTGCVLVLSSSFAGGLISCSGGLAVALLTVGGGHLT